MIRRLADLVDRFVNWAAPLPNLDGADWLTEYEAEHDYLPADPWVVQTRQPGASPDSVPLATPDSGCAPARRPAQRTSPSAVGHQLPNNK